MAGSEAVAADLMQQAFGTSGVVFISGLVAVATLCSINATIFTGARTNFALGQDYVSLGWMGHWDQRSSMPVRALWVQTAIALLLVLIGALSRKGFETMVDYTAPVFWLFFLLVGMALLVLRRKEAQVERPFRVPFYPVIPLLFCAICLYMLHASVAYTGWGGLLGLGVLILGLPVLGWEQRIRQTHPR
jgi:APA family basic amino acid/polyamine antiporter